MSSIIIIRGRTLAAPKLITPHHRHMKEGGWIEFQELFLHPRRRTGSAADSTGSPSPPPLHQQPPPGAGESAERQRSPDPSAEQQGPEPSRFQPAASTSVSESTAARLPTSPQSPSSRPSQPPPQSRPEQAERQPDDLEKYYDYVSESFSRLGLDTSWPTRLGDALRAAGFTNVTREVVRLPIGAQPGADQKVGHGMLLITAGHLAAYAARPFDTLGMDPETARRMLNAARRALRNPPAPVRRHFDMYFWYAQKRTVV